MLATRLAPLVLRQTRGGLSRSVPGGIGSEMRCSPDTQQTMSATEREAAVVESTGNRLVPFELLLGVDVPELELPPVVADASAGERVKNHSARLAGLVGGMRVGNLLRVVVAVRRFDE